MTDQDTIRYDSLDNRPLPKWLTDQRSGLNTYQPPKFEMKEDRSIDISLMITGIFVFSIVILLTVIVLMKKKNNKI
jgi:lipopolysaccharide/colanic/teichoic acid biosynthesis glycosyltransferase